MSMGKMTAYLHNRIDFVRVISADSLDKLESCYDQDNERGLSFDEGSELAKGNNVSATGSCWNFISSY